MGLFDRLPANFKPGAIFQLGRGNTLRPAGANSTTGQFLQRDSSGDWDGHTLVLADVGSTFDATAPTTSAVGDAAAAGSAATAAHRDHKHAREAFAAPTTEQTVGSAAATGSATTVPRSDHAHGNPTAASIGAAIAPAWTDFTPIAIQGSTVTTITVTYARYLLIGKLAVVQVKIAFTGATGAVGNNPVTIGTVPAAIAPKQTGDTAVIGSGIYFQSGVAFYTGVCVAHSASQFQLFRSGATGGGIGADPNLTVANGDVISVECAYEVA